MYIGVIILTVGHELFTLSKTVEFQLDDLLAAGEFRLSFQRILDAMFLLNIWAQ